MADPYEDMATGATPTTEADPYDQLATQEQDPYEAVATGGPGVLDYALEAAKRVTMPFPEQIVADPLRAAGVVASAGGLQTETRNLPAEQAQQAQMTPEDVVPPQRFNYPLATDVRESKLYQAGETVSKLSRDFFAPKDILNPFVGDLLGGFGSLMANIAQASIPIVGAPSLALTAPMQGISEAAQAAVRFGATPEQQVRAGQLGTVSGATEFVDALLPGLGTPAKVASFLGKVGAKFAVGAFVEGGQEGVQKLIQNAIAKGIYNPNQSLFEDVPYNALIGSLVGGPAKAALDRGEVATTPRVPRTIDPLPVQDWTSIFDGLEEELVPGAKEARLIAPLDATRPPDTTPLPPVGVAPPLQNIEAYHGSPYDFGEFDVTHIGSGEGAQSYGHGLYFAEAPGVAETYKAANGPLMKRRHELHLQLAELMDFPNDPELMARAEEVRNELRALEGNVYRVRIKAKPEQFLDWDRPLAEQSPFIQQALQGVTTDPRMLGSDIVARIEGMARRGSILDRNGVHTSEPRRVASEFLAAAGIPGIRYLDQGSRLRAETVIIEGRDSKNRPIWDVKELGRPGFIATDFRTKSEAEAWVAERQPTRNYVVFDDKLITISHKNGQEFVRSQISELTPRGHQMQSALRAAVENAIRTVAGNEVASRTAILDQIPDAARAAAGWGGAATGRVGILGEYYPSRETRNVTMPLVRISLTAGLDSMQSAIHEGWHAIEGTLTRDEVATLIAATEHLRGLITQMNPSMARLYSMAESEEVWAEAASAYAYQKLLETNAPQLMPMSKLKFAVDNKLHPLVKAVLDKIYRIIAAIRSSLNHTLNIYKVEDIFEAFYQGEMASRRAGLPATMLERWWANEGGFSQQIQDMTEELAQQTQRNDSVAQAVEGEQWRSNQAQPELVQVKHGAERVFTAAGNPQPVPQSLRMAGVHADRLSYYKKSWLFLDRLRNKYPDFTPLVNYVELTQAMLRDIAKVHDVGFMIAKRWRSLGRESEPLAALIDDVMNMVYRIPQEVKKGIKRHPTSQELADLARKHGVSKDAMEVYELQKKFFTDMLTTSANLARADAKRLIKDQNALADRMVSINDQVTNQLKSPYFPSMRFGRYHVVVKDAKGVTIYREAFERRGVVSALRRQQKALREIKGKLTAGQTAHAVTMSENSVAYAGMPQQLLETIAENLNLDRAQRAELDELRYDMAPSASFRHQFQRKNYVAGYSHDFLRSFSQYAFHGGRHLGRVKYAWQMREQVSAAKAYSGNLASELGHFMEDHLQNTILNTKGDYGRIRGATFVYALGYVPAAAFVNLSQLMNTHAFLASRFGGFVRGDMRAAKSMAKALVNVKNFYRKASYEQMTDFEYRAIDYGIKSGRISETQGAELAGIAQGEPLLGMGSRRGVRAMQVFIEKSAFLFEMAEQVNRRATFRSTLELAMANPNSRGVKEAMKVYGREYAELVKQFNPREAQAIVAALHVVSETQYIYSKETRPRVMRGKASIFFVFMSYMLHTLQLLGANKSSVLPRYLLYMYVMAGAAGLPGADELEWLFNQFASRFFGKDFKLRQQLREWLKDLFGNDADLADLAIHGLSSRGFGVPAVVDWMGEHVTGNKSRGLSLQHSQNVPFPNIDMSRQFGMGHILPVDLNKLGDPGKDPNRALAEQGQRALGAALSIPVNVYKAIMDIHTPATDPKRWEPMLPASMKNLSMTYRAFQEGGGRAGRGGPASAAHPPELKFDPRDPEQAAELIVMAMGFRPARQVAYWNREVAIAEAEEHIKVAKEVLMIQYFEALRGNDPKEVDGMNKKLEEFNNNLPDYAKGQAVTVKGLRESMKSREKGVVYKEVGSVPSRKERGLTEYFRGLFPGAVDVKER